MQANLKRDPLEDVLAKLQGVKGPLARGGYDALCPVHGDDKTPHLHVEAGEKGVVSHCIKCGAKHPEIMAALGIEVRDTFWPSPKRLGRGKRDFELRDEAGNLRAIHHREDREDGSKRIWWSAPDGTGGLKGVKGDNLPLWGAEAVHTVPDHDPICLNEGEKAAFALTYRGIPAVATVCGAQSTPSPESLRCLARRKVILWPDNDTPGREHMKRIGKILAREDFSCELYWFEWGGNEGAPDKGDAADHPDVRKGNVEKIRRDLEAAPKWVPPRDKVADGASTFIHAIPQLEAHLELAAKTGGITGYRIGIPKIDNALHGLNRGYSYLVAARPNDGKSMLVGQAALNIASSQGRVLLCTPEMSEAQYLKRLACYMAGISYFDAEAGKTTAQDRASIVAAANVIAQLPLLVDDLGSQTIDRIRDNVERHEPDVLIVDYLQYLTPEDKRASRTQQVGQISRDLAQIKSDFDIPILVAAQLNRASSTEGRAPMLSDLRDSGEIEQDADVVLMIDRPKKGQVPAHEEPIDIYCRKNRMGQLWKTTLYLKRGQVWLTDREHIVGVVS